MLLSSGLLSACQSEPETELEGEGLTQQEPMDQGTSMAGPTVDDIIGNAETYMGQTVTIEGSVDDTYGQRVFTIASDDGMMGGGLGSTTDDQGGLTGDQGATTGDRGATANNQGATTNNQGATRGDQGMTTGSQGEQLIVILTDENGTTSMDQYVAGDGVRVTGTVGEFVLTEVEADYGVDIPAELEAEVQEGDPVIFASSVSAATGMNGGTGGQGLGNDGLGNQNNGLGTETEGESDL